jgi:hypothetical protein
VTIHDLPVWAQQLYWRWHGPIGNPQPRGENYVNAQGVFYFLMIEAVLAICILLGWWGCDKLITDATANKLVKALIAVILGVMMLVKLLNFAGA